MLTIIGLTFLLYANKATSYEELECIGGTAYTIGTQDDALNDIAGCGMQSCEERYEFSSILYCNNLCLTTEGCVSYTWADPDSNFLTEKTCTIYTSTTPNQKWGPNQIMCLPDDTEEAKVCSETSGCEDEYMITTSGIECSGLYGCRYATIKNPLNGTVECTGTGGCSGSTISGTDTACYGSDGCTEATIDSDSVECQGRRSCLDATITAVDTVVCLAFESCKNSDIATSNGGIHCEGYSSCEDQTADIEGDDMEINVIGHYGAQGATYRFTDSGTTHNALFREEYSFAYGSLYSGENNELYVYFELYEAGYSSSIYCEAGSTCTVTCQFHQACWNVVLYCDSTATCNLVCDSTEEGWCATQEAWSGEAIDKKIHIPNKNNDKNKNNLKSKLELPQKSSIHLIKSVNPSIINETGSSYVMPFALGFIVCAGIGMVWYLIKKQNNKELMNQYQPITQYGSV